MADAIAGKCGNREGKSRCSNDSFFWRCWLLIVGYSEKNQSATLLFIVANRLVKKLLFPRSFLASEKRLKRAHVSSCRQRDDKAVLAGR